MRGSNSNTASTAALEEIVNKSRFSWLIAFQALSFASKLELHTIPVFRIGASVSNKVVIQAYSYALPKSLLLVLISFPLFYPHDFVPSAF